MSYYTLIKDSFPVARKQHRCIWCGGIIHVGMKYRHEISKFDVLQDHRWHLDCDEAAAEYFNDGNGPEFIPYDNERPSDQLERSA